MKKIIAIMFIVLMLSACSGSKKEDEKPVGKNLTFAVHFDGGEEFEFTLDPEEAVSYEEIRNNVIEDSISSANWRSYFDIKEVYREHYEYDEKGNKTETYCAGNIIMTVLDDKYIYVDNWSRNGLEWEVFVDGTQSMTVNNNGKVEGPIVKQVYDIEEYSGADAMLIFTDFYDSWDEITQQQYEGTLNSYEMISCKGDLKLLKSDIVKYKKLKDNIYYFAAYESDENFLVIFVESDNDDIQREDEYNVTIYATDSYGEVDRDLSSINLPPWQAYIRLMKQVNE
ncbi:MAG: membrane lipoprotein lipid attachment site-containing protein [Erysipelotrichaceae bacterium]|nr:membrane lipoprotein lipid attachment site-containing protein [Erysipelotrichaceae bacterium]